MNPLDDDNNRIGHVIDLLTAQDATTWTITSLSFASQLILLGLYFQNGVTPFGRGLISLLGAVVAGVFLLFVSRSNWYMAKYMGLLSGTGRDEFKLILPGQSFLQKHPRLTQLALDKVLSAQTILAMVHGMFVTLWPTLFLLGLYGFLAIK